MAHRTAAAAEAAELGIPAICLFPYTDPAKKTEDCAEAWDIDNLSNRATKAIREDDKKGRHTTTHRSLFRLANGGLVIDVPGIREVKIAGLDEALAKVDQLLDRMIDL